MLAMSKELPELDEQIHAKEDKEDNEDAEVDIIDGYDVHTSNSAVTDDPDATECSSSFADTDSGSEKALEPSDAEGDSQFFGDSDLPFPNVFNDVIQERKKKLTNHWRSFVHPLMWRCKWTELKIKELDSQIAKYRANVSAKEELQQRALSRQTIEGGCSKMMPPNEQMNKKKVVKRRKRKSAERWFDTAANTSEHVIFSFLENQKYNQDGCVVHDDIARTAARKRMDEDEAVGVEDLLQFKCCDSFEEVVEEIEMVQLRVHRLKQQLNMLLPKDYPFSSTEDMDTNSGDGPSPSCSEEETQSIETMKPSNPLGDYDFGDMECYRDAVEVPDIIESTVGLLSSTDVTFQQPRVIDYNEDMLDNILMTSSVEVETKEEDARDDEPALHASLLSAGIKRKRGERKIASTAWGKKPHDDSDNH